MDIIIHNIGATLIQVHLLKVEVVGSTYSDKSQRNEVAIIKRFCPKKISRLSIFYTTKETTSMISILQKANRKKYFD
jgi:hypothetical protein